MSYKYTLLIASALVLLGVGSFWLSPAVKPTSSVATSTPAVIMPSATSSQPQLADTHSTDGATFQTYCAGSIERLNPPSGPRVLCHGELTIKAKTTAMDEYTELLRVSPQKTDFVSLSDVKQISPSNDPNARLFLLVEGLNDCTNELYGCGYNFSIKLKDLALKTDLRHFEESNFFLSENWKWNGNFTKTIGFIGICEGGCVPEALYGVSIERGVWEQLTEQEAFLNQDHYNGRNDSYKSAPFTHWGDPVWIDNDRFEVPLYDAQGKLLQQVKGSYRAEVENADYPQFHTK